MFHFKTNENLANFLTKGLTKIDVLIYWRKLGFIQNKNYYGVNLSSKIA